MKIDFIKFIELNKNLKGALGQLVVINYEKTVESTKITHRKSNANPPNQLSF